MQVATLSQASPFDQIRKLDGDIEFWIGRELMPFLGYTKWENFLKVIESAIHACRNAGNDPSHHFIFIRNVVKRPQGGGSNFSDYKLTRYACYLVAMNGNPRKQAIALAQSYFTEKIYQAETAQSAPSLESLLTHNLIKLSSLCEQNTARLDEIHAKLTAYEVEREKAEADLRALPAPTTEAAPVSTRMYLNRLVRDTVVANNICYDDVWRYIYRDFRDRYHVDLRARSKNTIKPGAKKPTKSCLDICEEEGLLEQLYATAIAILAGDLTHFKKREETQQEA